MKAGSLLIAFMIELNIRHSLPKNLSLSRQEMDSFLILMGLAGGFNTTALVLSFWIAVLVITGIGFWMNAPGRESNMYSSRPIQVMKFTRSTSGSSGRRKARQFDVDHTQISTHNRQNSSKWQMVIQKQTVLIILLLHFVELDLEPSMKRQALIAEVSREAAIEARY
jgi:hypothetical protein